MYTDFNYFMADIMYQWRKDGYIINRDYEVDIHLHPEEGVAISAEVYFFKALKLGDEVLDLFARELDEFNGVIYSIKSKNIAARVCNGKIKLISCL